MRITIVLIFILCYLNSYSDPIKPIKKDKKWEEWQDRVPVGAEFNVGIMAVDSDIKVNPKSFFTKIPKKHDKFICVSINSKDGKYKANLEYDISLLEKEDIYEFELPTIYTEKLRNYKENEVAIIVKSSASCSSTHGVYYISSWHKIDDIKNSIVYINSETPVVLALIDKNNKREDITCKKILETNAISYNCECEIPAYKLKNSQKIYLMKVVRSGGKPEPKKHGEIIIKI